MVSVRPHAKTTLLENMLIVLSDTQKADLAFLTQVEPDILHQFCRITIDFIQSANQNTKLFAAAAKNLGVRISVVENGIAGLCYLFTEAAKVNLSELDFIDSLMVLGFSVDTNNVIKQVYLEQRDAIRATLLRLSIDVPHFVDLDWRLDVQLASRNTRDVVQPTFLFHFVTEQSGARKTQSLQTDYTNLKRMQTELETALDELKTAYARRIGRNL